MWLDIKNTSTRDIVFKKLKGNDICDNCHFELRFRPETLAAASFPKIQVTTEGWILDRKQHPGQAGWDSLCLRHPGELTLPSGEALTLEFTGMNGDGRGGHPRHPGGTGRREPALQR